MIVDFFIGIIIAALAGLGVGGGGLLVLYLVFVKNMEQLSAQGINLLFFIAAACSSLFYHRKKRRIDYRLCVMLAVFGVVGAVIGSIIAHSVEPLLIRKIFGWLLVGSGVVTLFGEVGKRRK